MTVGYAIGLTAVCTNPCCSAGCIAVLVGHSCIDILCIYIAQLGGMVITGMPYLVDLNAIYHFSAVVRAGCYNRRAIITSHTGVFAQGAVVDSNCIVIAVFIQIFYITAVHIEVSSITA